MSEMISGFELAKRNGEKAIAMIVNGKEVDLSSLVDATAQVEFITKNSPKAIEIIRHTTAHIMAQAIKTLWPSTQLAIGPVIENGFYYDISCDHQLVPEDFEKIEQKMREIIKTNYKITREDISSAQALELFKNDKFPILLWGYSYLSYLYLVLFVYFSLLRK